MLHNKLCFLAFLLTFTGTHSFNVVYTKDHSSCKSTAATAPRFPNNHKSFRKDKIIGLGGGIEYAFDDSFCTWLKHAMRNGDVSCRQLKLATHTALAKWSEKHPVVFFIPVQNPKDAEVVIGTFSKAKAMFSHTFKGKSRSKAEKRLHHRQTIHTGEVSYNDLKTSTDMVAFAQPLSSKLQTAKTQTTFKKNQRKTI